MSTTTSRVSGGNCHPVADNPLRLLFGQRDGGCTLKELERNAKSLRLQARHGPIVPTEPYTELCQRQRSAEDYTLAQKQVTNLVQLAVALFFWPGDFGRPNPMREANSWLLEAEGLPQGHGRKAELLANAIRRYDNPAAEDWANHAATTAGAMLGMASPEVEAVIEQVGQAVKKVVERAISDFGETIEATELELLNAIDACVRLPEIHGATRAGDEVLAKQIKRIDAYLDSAYAMLNEGAWEAKQIGSRDVQVLVTKCQEAKSALQLLQRRPSLLQKVPRERPMHLNTVSAALAFRVAMDLHHWENARELVKGVEPHQIDPDLDEEFLPFLRVSCRAVPLVCLARSGHDVTDAFLNLEREFPDAGGVVRVFFMKAVEVASPGSRPRKPPPLPNASTNSETQSKSGYGCLAAVVGGLVVLLLALGSGSSSGSRTTPDSLPRETYRVPRTVAGSLRAEQTEIEQARSQLRHRAEQVDSLGRELELEAVYLDRSNPYAVTRYNSKVDTFNRMNAGLKGEQIQFNARVDAYNSHLRAQGR